MSSRRPRVKVAANLSIRRAPKTGTGGEPPKTPDAKTSCPNDTSLDSTEASAETPVGNVPAETAVKVDEVFLKQEKQDKQDKQEKQEKEDEQHFKLPKPVDDVPKHNTFHNSVSAVDTSSTASQNINTTTNINNNNNNNNNSNDESMSPRKQEARFGFAFPLSRKRNRTESLTSNKSLPEGITVNKVPRKVATKQEESQRTQENKKEARKRLTNIDNVNKQNLTMFDMIYYNPINNPMETPALSKRGSLENIPKTLEGRNSRSVSKSRSPTPAPAPAVVPKAPVQLTPQLKLGPNGEMILDEASLVIENEREKEMRETLASNEIVYQDEFSGNSGYYSRIRRTKDWTNEETIRFYRCLHTIGTDFSMMLTLFPCRSRRDLKLKFKKEERLNLQLVNKALQFPKQFKLDELKQQFAEEDEEHERIKEEQQQRAEEMQEKLRQEKLNKKLMIGISKGRNPKKRLTKSERAMIDSGTDESAEPQDITNTNAKPKRQRRKKPVGVPNEEESASSAGVDGAESVVPPSTNSELAMMDDTEERSPAIGNTNVKPKRQRRKKPVDVTNEEESSAGVDGAESLVPPSTNSELAMMDGTEERSPAISNTNVKPKRQRRKKPVGVTNEEETPSGVDDAESVDQSTDAVLVKVEGTLAPIHTRDHSLTKSDAPVPPENRKSPTHKRQSAKRKDTTVPIDTGDRSPTTTDALEPLENRRSATPKGQSVKGECTLEPAHTIDHTFTRAYVPEPLEAIEIRNPYSATSQSVQGKGTMEQIHTVGHSLTKSDEPLEDTKSATHKRQLAKGVDVTESTITVDRSLTKADALEPLDNTKSEKRQRQSWKDKGTSESASTGDHSAAKNPKHAKRKRRSWKGKGTPGSTHTGDRGVTNNSKYAKRRRRSRKGKSFKSKKTPSISSEWAETVVNASDLIELELPEPDQYIPNGAVDTIRPCNTPNAVEAVRVEVTTRPDASTVCQLSKIDTTNTLPLVEIPATVAMAPALQTTPVIMLESLNTPSRNQNADATRSKQPFLIDELTPVVIKYDGPEPDLEYLPLPGANAPVARMVRMDADASCSLADSREPLMELEPATAPPQKSHSIRKPPVACAEIIGTPTPKNCMEESPMVANTLTSPEAASVGGNVPTRSASPIRHKVESDTDPPAVPVFPKQALDDEDDAAEYSEEDECYVADEPIPQGDDDYDCTKMEEPDVTTDGYLCETVAEISIGKEEISTAGHHGDLPKKEIVTNERTKTEGKVEDVDLTEVSTVEAVEVEDASLGAEVAPEDEDGDDGFSLEDIDINSLVLVESQDANRPDKTIYEIYVVNPETGQLSEKPLDVPADVIGNIRAILEAADGGS